MLDLIDMNLSFDETLQAAKGLPESAQMELRALVWAMMARHQDSLTTIQF
jgi:hypothetical protein